MVHRKYKADLSLSYSGADNSYIGPMQGIWCMKYVRKSSINSSAQHINDADACVCI